MSDRINRQASEAEAEAMLEDLNSRQRAADEVREALSKHFTTERLAEVVAGLPPDFQAKFRQHIDEPPVRRTITINKKKRR